MLGDSPILVTVNSTLAVKGAQTRSDTSSSKRHNSGVITAKSLTTPKKHVGKFIRSLSIGFQTGSKARTVNGLNQPPILTKASGVINFLKAQVEHLCNLLFGIGTTSASLVAHQGTNKNSLCGLAKNGESWVVDSGETGHMTS